MIFVKHAQDFLTRPRKQPLVTKGVEKGKTFNRKPLKRKQKKKSGPTYSFPAMAEKTHLRVRKNRTIIKTDNTYVRVKRTLTYA